MESLRALQTSDFSAWVLGSDSIWSYPTVLTLHTLGLALLVGAAIVMDLRLLGLGRVVPLRTVAGLYFWVWVGFAINLTSGVVLFIVQAADRAVQPVFYLKLVFIVAALAVALGLKRYFVDGLGESTRARSMAAVSLVCWVAAIAAGRLMAYI